MAKIGINIATGSLQQPEMIVGIDLGTTNSLVAIIHPETKLPTALKEFDGSSIVPSVVHFDAFGNVEVGAAPRSRLFFTPSASACRAATSNCALTVKFESACAQAAAWAPR
jgi:molecular chaperone HscA